MPAPSQELTGPVHVVGAGLLGTSVALACRRAGLDVVLSDVRASHVRTAASLGAGDPYDGRPVQLVVVAVPPTHLAEAIATALQSPDVVVTDVGSVKSAPLHAVAALVDDAAIARYVGSHPMAGSEQSGPLAATESLFDGRPWAITPHAASAESAVAVVRALVDACGGVAVELDPTDHDRAVARTSHLPHLLSALVAGQLADAPAEHLALSGQGVRDVTRIAAGDPQLWRQIVGANADAVVEQLAQVRGRLDELIGAISEGAEPALVGMLETGVAGTRALPGKHGGPALPTVSVFVAVPDHPGELARVFGAAGESGVNIEDIRIDHDPGREVGLLELVVAEPSAAAFQEFLEARGWSVHR